jgi:sec-independent protein translocase protein TatA
MGIGVGEVIIIIAVIVVIFGATQIPKIARSLGEGLKEFKKAVKDAKEPDKDDSAQKKEEEKKK